MTTGYQSEVINGQLVPVAPAQAFSPLAYGSTLSGPGFWPRGGQWNLPPVMPSQTATTAAAEYSPSSSQLMSSSPNSPTSGVINNGKASYLNPRRSPVLWTIGLLGLSLFMLHKIHFRG